jgi:hypothetical protein
MAKLQEYIKNKKPEKEEKKEQPSPYLEPVISAIVESMMSKIKILKGEDGRTPTEEEILAVVNPHTERVKSEIKQEFSKEKLLRMIVALIPKVEDGKPGKDGKDAMVDYDFILSKIKVKDGAPGKDAILPNLRELAINTINVIEMLEGEDRIDAKAIKNLEKLIRKIVSQETIGLGNYGGPGYVVHDNTLQGNGIDSPLSVVQSAISRTWHEEYPSVGIVNGINKTYTFPHVVSFLSLEGQALSILNGDYTVDTTGFVATLANAPTLNPPVNKYSS